MASIVSIASMDVPTDVAGARKRSVVVNMAVYVCRLVHVVSGVTLYSGEKETIKVKILSTESSLQPYYLLTTD